MKNNQVEKIIEEVLSKEGVFPDIRMNLLFVKECCNRVLATCKDDEIDFLCFVLDGKGYTKEYYINMLEQRLQRLKQNE